MDPKGHSVLKVQVSKRDAENSEKLNTLISRLRLTIALRASVELGIPQILESNPLTAEELSVRTHTIPSKLHRMLRVLRCFGYYSYDTSSKTWSNSTLSSKLTEDIKYYLLFENNPLSINLPKFTPTLLTNNTHMRNILTEEFSIEAAYRDPKILFLFQTSMMQTCESVANILRGRMNLSEYKNALDIGGGAGNMLKFLLEENTHMKGTVFELEICRHFTESYIRSIDLKNRMSFVSGDFFEFVPKGYDVHLMKNVLHDWGDTQAKVILQKSREAINTKGLLIIIEMLTNQLDNTAPLQKLDDFKMVALLSGKTRTEQEYANLLQETGYRIHKIQESADFFSVLYAVPV